MVIIIPKYKTLLGFSPPERAKAQQQIWRYGRPTPGRDWPNNFDHLRFVAKINI
ncbi:hypothetical protein PL10110_300121 [Planktothrix agardhii]|nr:hypothetical protein PL10110_300121 [Planktothrix agardhii]